LVSLRFIPVPSIVTRAMLGNVAVLLAMETPTISQEPPSFFLGEASKVALTLMVRYVDVVKIHVSDTIIARGTRGLRMRRVQMWLLVAIPASKVDLIDGDHFFFCGIKGLGSTEVNLSLGLCFETADEVINHIHFDKGRGDKK